jgi:hypothetical protein
MQINSTSIKIVDYFSTQEIGLSSIKMQINSTGRIMFYFPQKGK